MPSPAFAGERSPVAFCPPRPHPGSWQSSNRDGGASTTPTPPAHRQGHVFPGSARFAQACTEPSWHQQKFCSREPRPRQTRPAGTDRQTDARERLSADPGCSRHTRRLGETAPQSLFQFSAPRPWVRRVGQTDGRVPQPRARRRGSHPLPGGWVMPTALNPPRHPPPPTEGSRGAGGGVRGVILAEGARGEVGGWRCREGAWGGEPGCSVGTGTGTGTGTGMGPGGRGTFAGLQQDGVGHDVLQLHGAERSGGAGGAGGAAPPPAHHARRGAAPARRRGAVRPPPAATGRLRGCVTAVTSRAAPWRHGLM